MAFRRRKSFRRGGRGRFKRRHGRMRVRGIKIGNRM